MSVTPVWGQTDQNGSVQETAKNPKSQKQETVESLGKNVTGKAGEKIGNSIERSGERAAEHLGGWINLRVAGDISWLKLGLMLVILFIVALVGRLLGWIIQIKIGRMPEEGDDIAWPKFFLKALSKPLSLFVWIYGVYIALSPLFVHFISSDGTNSVKTMAQQGAKIGGTVAVFWFIFRLVEFVDIRLKKWAAGTDSSTDDMISPLIGRTLRLFIAIIACIIIIQDMTGMKIGPLLASLGIGGLAVALAAKESIANFFGTLTILFDKPFKVGERIVIGGNDGIVESVGFRSTRIRTLTGHLLTIPNEKVISSPLENIGKRPFIRWLADIGITYDTPPEKVEKAVDMIREILENHEGMTEDLPPKVFFNGFRDYSLNITAMVWYHPPNYWDYQSWLQKTCLEIIRCFESEGIEFAFPTSTLYLANDNKRRLMLQILKGENQ
jgi:MscS family membrane protein